MIKVTLFSQIISKLDSSKFKSLVYHYQTDKHQKGFNSWSHLVSMLFCQFAKSQSVRDISNGLRSATGNLNHLGVLKAPSKSTLSYQNTTNKETLFNALCAVVAYLCKLEDIANVLDYAKVFEYEENNPVYKFDVIY